MESKTDNLALQLKQACQLYIDDYYFFPNPEAEIAQKAIQFINTYLSASVLSDFEDVLTKGLILALLNYFECRGIEEFSSKVNHLCSDKDNENISSIRDFWSPNFYWDFICGHNLGQDAFVQFSMNLERSNIDITPSDIQLICNVNKVTKAKQANLVIKVLSSAITHGNYSIFCEILNNSDSFNKLLSVDGQSVEYKQVKSVIAGSLKDDMLRIFENHHFGNPLEEKNLCYILDHFAILIDFVRLTTLHVDKYQNSFVDDSPSFFLKEHFYWQFICPKNQSLFSSDVIRYLLSFSPIFFLQGENLKEYNCSKFADVFTNVIESLDGTSENQKKLKEKLKIELNTFIWQNHGKYVANVCSFFQPKDIGSVVISKYAEHMNYSV